MKYKKGSIGFIAGIILAILVVGAVAYISLRSIGISVTSIFEPLKKFIGLETSKTEASTAKTGVCIIKRYYWSKNNARIGEILNVVIEGGDGSCDGKSVMINIYKDRIFIIGDKLQKSFDGNFKEGKININYQTNEKGSFYFILKFEGKDFTSNVVKIE